MDRDVLSEELNVTFNLLHVRQISAECVNNAAQISAASAHTHSHASCINQDPVFQIMQ